MRRSWWMGPIVLLVGAVACDDVPTVSEIDEEPDDRIAIIEIPEEPDDPPAVEPMPVELYGWPGRHEQLTFELTWLGGGDELGLLKEPNPEAEEVATASPLDADQLNWVASIVYVEIPRTYLAEASHTLRATPYDVEGDELEDDEIEFEIEADDPVFLYQYFGEETCILAVEGQMVVAPCPEEKFSPQDGEDSPGEATRRWEPVSQKWWVKVRTDDGSGWFAVEDQPIDVHMRSLEGFDEIDGPGIEEGRY